MTKLIKLYGLPRTGTNLLNLLMGFNFKEFVCTKSQHDVHYLGWKHGKPAPKKVISVIEEITQTDIYFVFIKRALESWKDAIENRHKGNWEFPFHTYSYEVGKFLYSTPMGYELYESIDDLHFNYNSFYEQYTSENDSKCIVVTFEELIENQTQLINKIKRKFNLTLAYEKPIEIKRQVSMDERF